MEADAAHARPPGGTVGEPASYASGGLLLRASGGSAATLEALGYGGTSLGEDAGTWTGGLLAVDLAAAFGRFALGARVEANGLRYADPFAYTAVSGEARPFAALYYGAWTLRADGRFTRGRWSGEQVQQTGGPGGPLPLPFPGGGEERVEVSGDLALTGGRVSLSRRFGFAQLTLAGTGLDAENGAAPGSYRGVEAGLSLVRGRWSAGGAAGLWRTPEPDGTTTTEAAVRLDAAVELTDGLSARMALGRGPRDPLYGVPGSFGASLGFSWAVPLPTPAAAKPIVELGAAREGGRLVRFHVHAPDAREAAVAGDFSDWRPLAMRREGDGWTTELVVEPGLHHFSFVLNGEEWVVPDHAPGLSDDGWGRRTGSFLVETM